MKLAWKRLASLSVVFCLLLVSALVGSGCGNQPTPDIARIDKTPSTLSGVIREAGSTSVLPLAEKFALAFMDKNPDLEITYTGGGSGAGVEQCASQVIDIGAASRELKITEKDLILYPIARDGVAMIVNELNPVVDLTLQQIARIYAGEITNWSELGGSDLVITLYGREEGSGTRDCFDEKVMEKSGVKVSDKALSKKSNGEIQIGIQEDQSGIGYVSIGYLNGVKSLSVEGVSCNLDTCKNGSYSIVRRLYFITKEIPKSAVQAFIDFCRSEEGQKIVSDNGYVPLIK